MSIDSARICCTGCSFETLEVYRPILVIYRLDNGKEVTTGRSKGWCYECDSYADIEDLDSGKLSGELAEEERERRDNCSRIDEIAKGFITRLLYRAERRRLLDSIRSFDKEIQALSDLLNIAMNRKTGARCLTCWSGRTMPVTFGSDNLTHNFLHHCDNFLHHCGSKLQIIYNNEGMRFNFARTTYVLTADGELIT